MINLSLNCITREIRLIFRPLCMYICSAPYQQALTLISNPLGNHGFLHLVHNRRASLRKNKPKGILFWWNKMNIELQSISFVHKFFKKKKSRFFQSFLLLKLKSDFFQYHIINKQSMEWQVWGKKVLKYLSTCLGKKSQTLRSRKFAADDRRDRRQWCV